MSDEKNTIHAEALEQSKLAVSSLAELAASLKVGHKEIASCLGISKGTVAQFFRHRYSPSVDTLCRYLCAINKVSGTKYQVLIWDEAGIREMAAWKSGVVLEGYRIAMVYMWRRLMVSEKKFHAGSIASPVNLEDGLEYIVPSTILAGPRK